MSQHGQLPAEENSDSRITNRWPLTANLRAFNDGDLVVGQFIEFVNTLRLNPIASCLRGFRHRNIQLRTETNNSTVSELLKEHVVALR